MPKAVAVYGRTLQQLQAASPVENWGKERNRIIGGSQKTPKLGENDT